MFNRTCLAAAAVSTTMGCIPSFTGDWDGRVDCGDDWGQVEVDVDLEGTGGGEHEGDGDISRLLVNGDRAIIFFDIEVDKTKVFGFQEIDIDVDNCFLEIEGGDGPEPIACFDTADEEFDGNAEIDANIFDFLGTGYDCELDLNR